MGADVIETVYLICFFLGLCFAIVCGLLSGVFEAGGGDADVDAGGDLDAGGAGDGAVAFSPLSPVVLAMFVASFGGAGIIMKKVLEWPLAMHLTLAAVSGFVIAGLTFYVFSKMFKMTQGTSQISADEVIGMEGEITVPIPNHGVGQIAYTVRGRRFTNTAQTADGKELPAGMVVKIVKRVGTTYHVEKVG